MAKSHRLRILETLYEDAGGVAFRAKDASGHKVLVRKPKPESAGAPGLPGVEQVAYQVAIERLSGIHHPSLLTVVSGGNDPQDGLPYISTRPAEGESLAARLKARPLSLELATAMVSQALEVSELLSELLAEDGVWIETSAESILVTAKSHEPNFIFWPSPLKAVQKSGKAGNLMGILELAERALNWSGREVDEREGGHLLLWLQWLREAKGDVPIHEAREMLAAAAGVEPPEPVEKLLETCRNKPGRFEALNLSKLLKWQAPKMPLFVLLCVMLVIQSIIGWIIVRTLNSRLDEQLDQLNDSYTENPYTIDRDPSRKPERGSEPLDFD